MNKKTVLQVTKSWVGPWNWTSNEGYTLCDYIPFNAKLSSSKSRLNQSNALFCLCFTFYLLTHTYTHTHTHKYSNTKEMDSASACKIQHVKPLCQIQLLCTIIPTCHTAVLVIAKVAVSVRREAVTSIRPDNPCNYWMQDTLKKLVCMQV